MTSLPMIFPLPLTGVRFLGFFGGGEGGGQEGTDRSRGSKHQLLSRNRKWKCLWKNIQNLFSHAAVLQTDTKEAEGTNLQLPNYNGIPFIQSTVYEYALFT